MNLQHTLLTSYIIYAANSIHLHLPRMYKKNMGFYNF